MMEFTIQPAARTPGQPAGRVDGNATQDNGFSHALRSAAGAGESAASTQPGDDARAPSPTTPDRQDQAPSTRHAADPDPDARLQGKAPVQQHPAADDDDKESAQHDPDGRIRLPGKRDVGGRASRDAHSGDADERPGTLGRTSPKHADELPPGISAGVVGLLRNEAFAAAAREATAANKTAAPQRRASTTLQGARLLTTDHAGDADKAGKPGDAGITTNGIQPATHLARQTVRTSTADTTARSAHTDPRSAPGKAIGAEIPASVDATRTGAIAGAQHSDAAGVPTTPTVPFSPGSPVHAATPGGALAAPPAAAALPAPVASAAWQQQLGQQLVQMVQRGTDRIDLHLNPKELGPLQVSLQLHDQTAQVHFLVAHADVHDAVQQAIPQLREALANQGISLGGAQVGQQQQQSTGAFDGEPGSPAWTARDDATEAIESIRHTATVASIAAAVGGVDLYA